MKSKDASRVAKEIAEIVRTYELPGPMRLGELVEQLAILWETDEGCVWTAVVHCGQLGQGWGWHRAHGFG
jgi:hypothetical protein